MADDEFSQYKTTSDEFTQFKGTPTGPQQATIGVNRGPAPTGSAGYQYSTGYAGEGDAQRASGGFIDRMTTAAGQALQHPSNFLPSWTALFPPLMAAQQAKQEWNAFQAERQGTPVPRPDPAQVIGSQAPAALTALVTHVADAVPNPAELAKSKLPGLGSGTWADPAAALAEIKARAARASTPLEQSSVLGKVKQPDIASIANPARDTATLKQVQADHPDWTLSQQLQEAAKRVTPSGTQVVNIPAGKFAKPVGAPPVNIPMESAQSGTIDLHGYHPETRTMQVQFKNGNVYQLKGVPQEVFNNYRNAESQGSFYQQNLKGRYETSLVGKVKPTVSAGTQVKQALSLPQVEGPMTAEEAANTQRFLEAMKQPSPVKPPLTPEQEALQAMQDQAWQESIFGKGGGTGPTMDIGEKIRAQKGAVPRTK